MTALPVTPWTRVCDCDEERVVSVELVLNEAEDGYDEVPTFLEDTGNAAELKLAKQLAMKHFARRIIKRNYSDSAEASALAAAYQALATDLGTA